MDLLAFQLELEKRRETAVRIRINDNYSTVLSYRQKKLQADVFSMHRIFLTANEEVQEALLQYACGRNNKFVRLTLKQFMHEAFKNIDYSSRTKEETLHSKGKFFNLESLLSSINKEYFEEKAQVKITWFGQPRKLRRKIPTLLGQYNDLLKLIKIHRWLDHKSCPQYFISFVIYHEILHAIYPPYLDDNKRCHFHDRHFREKEKQFKEYHLAKAWEKNQQWQLC